MYIFNIYIHIYNIYMVLKIEQFCISFEICCVILNLFLLTLEHVYYVLYNRYMKVTVSSVIRLYYRVV